LRVSFDSNAWEEIFDPANQDCGPIRNALAVRALEGFICEAGFCIEAVRKRDRSSYFAQPYMDTRSDGIVMRDGQPRFHLSFGPDDDRHPGLPAEQVGKLQSALAAGVRLMRGLNWMGLPAPQEIRDPSIFAAETREAKQEREQLQLDASVLIDARGVGRAAFDAAGGWDRRIESLVDDKRLQKACAEWADGELVSAHIAYRNDVLCTNDRARAAGRSVFDPTNRSWLSTDYGVVFKTLAELVEEIAK
jgi:hypothetical protein